MNHQPIVVKRTRTCEELGMCQNAGQSCPRGDFCARESARQTLGRIRQHAFAPGIIQPPPEQSFCKRVLGSLADFVVLLLCVAALFFFIGFASKKAQAQVAQQEAGLRMQPTAIGLHIGTKHSRSGLNNVNPGAYMVFSDSLVLGGYYNSERHASAYAAWQWQTEPLAFTGPLRLRASVLAGLVTGYESRRVMPLLLPSLSMPLANTGASVRLSFVPRFEKRGAAALHASLEWSL